MPHSEPWLLVEKNAAEKVHLTSLGMRWRTQRQIFQRSDFGTTTRVIGYISPNFSSGARYRRCAEHS